MKVLAVVLLAVALAQAAVLPRFNRKISAKPVLPTAPSHLPQGSSTETRQPEDSFPTRLACLVATPTSMVAPSFPVPGSLHLVPPLMDIANGTSILVPKNIFSTNEPGRVTLISRNAILHEAFNPTYLNNNIAVIQLPRAVTTSQYIKVVNLPTRSPSGDTFEGETLRVSGWGYTSGSDTSITTELNYIDLTVISNAECESVYGYILLSVLCTDGTSGNTCAGDGGGPLVQISGTTVTQIGVLSFYPSAGCESGYPSAFSRTTAYLEWISTSTGIQID